MGQLLWICLAGAAGTATRYLLAMWAARQFGSAFPYGTLIVNMAGCFAIAGVMHVATVQLWPPTLRAALTIGFLGGFTTYSAFNYETMQLAQEGAWGAALLNLALTIGGCLVAGWSGLVVARQLFGD